MHADGRRCNDKSRHRLNCFPHCDRAAMKETLLAYRQQRAAQCPKGLAVDRLACSINQAAKEHFIRLYLCSSCEKDALQQYARK